MTRWNEKTSRALIEETHKRGETLTMALRAQVDAFGYVDEAAITPLMQTFARSRAEVLGVIAYYDDFRTTAPGRHVVRLCQAEACQAVGARELTAHMCEKTGLTLGQTSADGALTLEGVYCLGLCANGPAALIDDRPVAELDENRLDTMLDELKV
ncbi:MAG: NADH-quinone oxidoreductase subunit E [Robiginitomaculum sp.]|nr:MAG: NADH-quinone oxidoreductase subunit E [Robiginitomaculum sp.]